MLSMLTRLSPWAIATLGFPYVSLRLNGRHCLTAVQYLRVPCYRYNDWSTIKPHPWAEIRLLATVRYNSIYYNSRFPKRRNSEDNKCKDAYKIKTLEWRRIIESTKDVIQCIVYNKIGIFVSWNQLLLTVVLRLIIIVKIHNRENTIIWDIDCKPSIKSHYLKCKKLILWEWCFSFFIMFLTDVKIFQETLNYFSEINW